MAEKGEDVFTEKSSKSDDLEPEEEHVRDPKRARLEDVGVQESSEFVPGDLERPESVSSLSEECNLERETFEAEGQLNLTMSELEQPQETEEEYLLNIWGQLGLGREGHLTVAELAKMCELFGMEEMDDQDLQQQLFNKLDSDGDGKVSFEDFRQGLFQHTTPTPACHTPRSMGTPTLRTLSAQKKIKVLAAERGEERHTPSIVSGSGISGIFTSLDHSNTGFSMPDDIIDLWEQYNVSNGADVLLALGFELNTKVNLSELSLCLEHELINNDDQNAVYQAAVSSYQQEIRHLKSAVEQSSWECDKLKQDLQESNVRNNKLIKEVDERHINMEKTAEKKLSSVEKKYQEQVKGLQQRLEEEREQCQAQMSSLQKDVEEEKQEGRKLLEALNISNSEVSRLETELGEIMDKYTESEKLNEKLQKELSSLHSLQLKLEEYESKGLLSPEQQQFAEDKIDTLTLSIKELQDRNDELTSELENVRMQYPALRKSDSSLTSPRHGSRIPVRDGSVMGDYLKGRKGSSFSSETSEDEAFCSPTSNQSVRTRRKLPQAPTEEEESDDVQKHRELLEQIGRLNKTIEGYKHEADSSKSKIKSLEDEIETIRKDHLLELKKVEEHWKNEMSALEEKHEQDNGEIFQQFEEDQARIREECEKIKEMELTELQDELTQEFETQKQNLVQKQEQKMKTMQEQFNKEHTNLAERLKREYASSLDSQIKQMRDNNNEKMSSQSQEHAQVQQEKEELEEQILTQQEEFEEEKVKIQQEYESKMEELRGQYDLEILTQREELETKFNNEREELESKLEIELKRIHDEQLEEISQMGRGFSGGVDCLKGQTKTDFYALLEDEKQMLTAQLEEEFSEQLQQETERIKTKFEYENEDTKKKYEEQINLLKLQIERFSNKMDIEHETMAKRFEAERDTLEEELARTIREELEMEFFKQIEELKDSFEEERRELEQQIAMYKEEVEDLQKELETADGIHAPEDSRSLQRDKIVAEKQVKSLKSTLEQQDKMYQEKISSLEEENDNLRQSSRGLKDTVSKKTHELLMEQCNEVKSQVHILQEQKQTLEMENDKLCSLQESSLNDWEKERQMYEDRIKDLEKSVEDFDTKIIPPFAKSIIDSLNKEKSDLQREITETKSQSISLQQELSHIKAEEDQRMKALDTDKKELSVKLNHLNNKLTDSSSDLLKEKEKLLAIQVERNKLEEQLTTVQNKLHETQEKMIQNEDKFAKELEKFRNKNNNVEDFTCMQIDFVDYQRKLRDLHEEMQEKQAKIQSNYKAKEEEFRRETERLNEEKASLRKKLQLNRDVLDEQLQKIKCHYNDCEKRNVLVVDLYKENADLMEALFIMEERKKDAVSRCYKLEDQCRALRKMLKRVCHVAVS